jgi:hypothetical protein
VAYIALVVGADSFEAADGNRLFLDSASAADRFARSVADPPQDSGEDVRFPVDHIGVIIFFGRDKPNIFRNSGVGGATVLAIYDPMKVLRIMYICRLQKGVSHEVLREWFFLYSMMDIVITFLPACEEVFPGKSFSLWRIT